MKFWSLEMIRHSPLMPAQHAWELSRFYVRPPSEPAFDACLRVAQQIKPVEAQGLVIIESVNAPMRLAYTEYPSFDEWMRLERASVFEADDGYLFLMMESLH